MFYPDFIRALIKRRKKNQPTPVETMESYGETLPAIGYW